MFYKAKQDSLDDLSKEMLKSMDELTTKLMRYAEKDDLELLRDTMENKINTMMKESAAPAAETHGQQQKTEIESLMSLLDEQFKKGLMSKKDYEKAKQANMQKLKEMQAGPAKPDIPRTPARQEQGAINQPPAEEANELESPPQDIGDEDQAQEKPSHVEAVLTQASMLAQPSLTKEEKPLQKEPETAKPKAAKNENTEKTLSKEDLIRKISPPKEKAVQKKPQDKKQKMLSDLEDSFRKGLISQRAYESTQRIIMAKKF
jgi:hypothetical protein